MNLNKNNKVRAMTFNHLKQRFQVCLVMMLISIGLAAPGAFAGNGNKDKVKIKKILQNRFYEGCNYSGTVALEVKYKLKSADYGQIVLEGTQDGASYFHLLSKEIEGGNGRTTMVFEASDCLQDVRVTLE